jgi:diguanylate cyclase (GGDEF)-like protein/PAS domain S-box-containing protein
MPPGALDRALLADAAPVGLVATDADWNVVAVNPALTNLTGRPAEELVGRSMGRLLTRAGRFVHQAHYAPRVLAEGVLEEVAFDLVHADGARVPVLLSTALVDDPGRPRVAHLTAVVRVARRRDLERDLRETQRAAEAAYRELEHVHGASHRLAAAFRAEEVSACLADVLAELGAREVQVVLRPRPSDGAGETWPPAAPPAGMVARAVGAPADPSACLVYRPGSGRAEASDPPLPTGDPERVLGPVLDAAAQALTRIELLRQLERQALTDELTGLDNRRSFQRTLEALLSQRRRSPSPLTLLVLDLDGFKAVNDRLGHATGDRLLAEVAVTLRATLRDYDLIARLGGDEFAMLTRGHHDRDDAERVARRLDRAIATRHGALGIGGSIGVVHLAPGEDPHDTETLLAEADRAMYAVKRTRNGEGPPLGEAGPRTAEPS